VWGLLFLWSLCVFGYISVVVEEGGCVLDCRGLGLYKFGIVGVQWVMSVKEGRELGDRLGRMGGAVRAGGRWSVLGRTSCWRGEQ
jgi:hypothetical protein